MAYCLLDEIDKHEGLMKVSDVARIFKVKTKAVYSWIAKGSIPVIEGFGMIRIDPRSLAYTLGHRNPVLKRAQRS